MSNPIFQCDHEGCQTIAEATLIPGESKWNFPLGWAWDYRSWQYQGDIKDVPDEEEVPLVFCPEHKWGHYPWEWFDGLAFPEEEWVRQIHQIDCEKAHKVYGGLHSYHWYESRYNPFKGVDNAPSLEKERKPCKFCGENS